MKNIRGTVEVLVFTALLIVGAGCDSKSGSSEGSGQSGSIQIEAIAFRETPMLGARIEYPFYTVLLKLTNHSKKAFVFDKMEVAWQPSSGKVLTGVSTPGQSGRGFRIEPGETKEYWESSGDRTLFLLRDAGGKPLRFQVTLLHGDTPVFGPISAPLPDLASLKDVHADGRGAGTLLAFLASSKKPKSTTGVKHSQSAGSTQHIQIRKRRQIQNLEGMAVMALEGGMLLTSFREGAILGNVGSLMTDGRVEVVIRRVQRKPYFNPMAKNYTATHEYEALFTIANRGSSKEVIDTVEGIIYSESPEPIIRTITRTITCYYDKSYYVHQSPTELAPGEFDEFAIPTMGREGNLKSIGIALTYQDKTESRFWVLVPPDKISEVSGDR